LDEEKNSNKLKKNRQKLSLFSALTFKSILGIFCNSFFRYV